MKKKIIVPIVLSSIGLLIGGLVYLGISSFPELLESEKSAKPVNNKVVPFVDDTVVVESDKLFQEEPTIVSEGGVGGYVTEYIPSSLNNADVQYVDAPATTKETKSSPKFINISHVEFSFIEDEAITVENHFETAVDSFVVETNETSHEHLDYVSQENVVEETPLKVKKVKSVKATKNQKIRSNEALVETSLIVIGVVDIFSMILIHRRKHLFR